MPRMMLTQPLHRASRLHPQRVATCCADRTRSYAELSDRVARLAAALLELGLQPGERVGVLAQNSDRYIEAMFAVWRSEEHTSELQSLMRISYAVFCLKKKKTKQHKR